MGKMKGTAADVKFGGTAVVGMGTWNWNGITANMLAQTEFGDFIETYKPGMKEGGNVGFNGLRDPADSTGQELMKKLWLNGVDITSLQLFLDNTSYYEFCQTAGYWDPGAGSTGMGTVASWGNVSAFDETQDKSDMMKVSFTIKVSGYLVLV